MSSIVCSICYKAIDLKQSGAVVPPCGHTLHEGCLKRANSRRCPVCSRAILRNQLTRLMPPRPQQITLSTATLLADFSRAGTKGRGRSPSPRGTSPGRLTPRQGQPIHQSRQKSRSQRTPARMGGRSHQIHTPRSGYCLSPASSYVDLSGICSPSTRSSRQPSAVSVVTVTDVTSNPSRTPTDLSDASGSSDEGVKLPSIQPGQTWLTVDVWQQRPRGDYPPRRDQKRNRFETTVEPGKSQTLASVPMRPHQEVQRPQASGDDKWPPSRRQSTTSVESSRSSMTIYTASEGPSTPPEIIVFPPTPPRSPRPFP